MPLDIADLNRRFRHFAGMCEGYSELYATLSPAVADDPSILALTAPRQRRQPPVNLLFGAVHDLLLAGVEHPLAAFYPSVGGRRHPRDAFPAFADFCRAFEERIVDLIAAKRVQTNEVGRCGLMMPAFAMTSERFDGRPLHLVDVGASAGLNLLFDRYHYEYTSVGLDGVHSCGPDSPARIRTELREGTCPLPEDLPRVAGRVGIDMAPVDVTDDDATRWVEALIWPDMLHRHELFRAAVALARDDPPRVVAGDALELLPDIVASAPPDALPCVFHSHAIYQMPDEWRERFDQLLAGLGRDRDLAHVSLEWLGDDPGPQLYLTTFAGGNPQAMHLADCHHHGVWMRWLGDPAGRSA